MCREYNYVFRAELYCHQAANCEDIARRLRHGRVWADVLGGGAEGVREETLEVCYTCVAREGKPYVAAAHVWE